MGVAGSLILALETENPMGFLGFEECRYDVKSSNYAGFRRLMKIFDDHLTMKNDVITTCAETQKANGFPENPNNPFAFWVSGRER